MRRISAISFLFLRLAAVALVVGWGGCAKREEAKEVVLFDRDQAAVIVVPEQASEGELRAARLIQGTLAKAARRARHDFVIVRQAPPSGPVIELRGLSETTGPKLEEWVAYRIDRNRVEISSYPAEAIEAAAAWFLGITLEARWFMPGALGEHILPREELRLPFGEVVSRPSYISRYLSFSSSAMNTEWMRRNRSHRRFNHGHAMNTFFSPQDLQANPTFVPLINGQRRIPTEGAQNWQPHIAGVAAAEHAAGVLRRKPEFSSAIGMNDTWGYDQSEETRRVLGESKWFRHRPDFSPLVFRFVNEVAKRVPDRYLGAYAYHWTEDTPSFRIEKNVVPYLTADRSEWFDPRFEEEDKALIKRWVAAGPEVVGIYDYYYGAPYFVPRPTLYAVSQSIPFAHEAGVRAFYAELYPNWALDGPKAWLAMQLLWDAKAKPDALLTTYYTEFWREAAGPMREFFALCDEPWLNQPKPSYWIKYYKDEHQYLLFPREIRAKLRGLLDQAVAGATTELTRNRLRFVSAGFSVTEAFCQWNETRDSLSRAALTREVDAATLREMQEQYTVELEQFRTLLAEVKQQHPLAISAELMKEYTRNDPRRRADVRLGEAAKQRPESEPAKSEGLGANSEELRAKGDEPGAKDDELGAKSEGQSAKREGTGPELLADTTLTQLEVGPTAGFFDLAWVKRGPWRAQGEPYQTRRVSVVRGAGSKEQGAESVGHGGRRTDDGRQTTEDGGQTTEGGRHAVVAYSQPGAGPQFSRGEIEAGTTEDGGQSAEGEEPRAKGEELTSGGSVLRMEGCKDDMFSQIVRGEAGKRYVARVKVRGRVSPGNFTFIILNFQDAKGVTLGMGTIDRLPVGEFDETVELITWADAPAEAVRVGMGVRVINQVGEDFAEVHGFSIREADLK